MRYAVGLLVGLVPSLMLGATLQVDDDWSHCHSANFRSIAAAIAGSTPGDVIEVCPGRYEESLTIPHELTLRGWGPAAELRVGDPATETVLTQRSEMLDGMVVRANRVRIEGFTFLAIRRSMSAQIRTLPSVSGTAIVGNAFVEGRNCVVLFNADRAAPARVEGNYFNACVYALEAVVQGALVSRNLMRYFINGFVFMDSTPVTVSNNVSQFHSIGSPTLTVVNSSRFTITGNRIESAHHLAIQVVRSSRIEIAYNTIEARESGGIRLTESRSSRVMNNSVQISGSGYPSHHGVSLYESTDIDVWFNVLDGLPASGIYLRNASQNRIAGNRITSSGAAGLLVDAGSRNNLILVNELRGNATFDAHEESPGANWWLLNDCVTDNPAGTICR